MASLAKVELQSVMHFLDCRSMLIFARCSRWLYAVADCDFAWKHQPPPQLQFSSDRLSLPQQLSHSLWRHLPSVAIEWMSPQGWLASFFGPYLVSSSELHTLLRFPRISSLSIRKVKLSMEQWQQLGQSHSLDSLTSLTLSWLPAPVGFLQPLTRLPRLSYLIFGFDSLSEDERLDQLSQLQSLTRLDVSISNHAACDSIAHCNSLSHLRLCQVHCGSPSFLSMLHSPSLKASLQSLDIDNGTLILHLSKQQLQLLFRAAFSGFMRLRSLTLRNCIFNPDSLLLHLVTALSLTHLLLQPPRRFDLPPASLITQVLQSGPQLHFTLDIKRSDEEERVRLAAQIQQLDLTPDQRSRFTLLTN